MSRRRASLVTPGVLALVASLALAPRAHAVEDGGTQSVFAYGAGNRALAMGGAGSASAIDATALFWNPAGLARAPRAGVSLAQSGDLGVGIREGFGALALPSWRWGTAAFSWRHFGVDGLEGRDDRNAVVDGSLTDAEDEAMLGLARTFGGAWDVGATVKSRHQSLAGYSASGFGADLGVRLRPAQLSPGAPAWLAPWTLGLAVRNAVQPSLRLDQQSVADPTGVRAGLAFAPRTRLGDLVADLDLERPAHAGTRLHAGLELAPVAAAALRVGVDRDRLTAGLGVRWNGVALDYAYVDGAIAAAHRLGVSFHFGRDVDAARAAARQAEDEALQRRLADVFRARQAEQVNALLARASASEQAGRWDDALDALGAALTLAPEDAGTTAAQQRCLRGKAADLESRGDLAAAAVTYELAIAAGPVDTAAVAGAKRCREEGDRRAKRGEALRHRFADGMDAYAAGRFADARRAFAEVAASEPGDRDAATMLERTRAAIARRASGLVEQASRWLRAGIVDGVAPLLDQAAALDSSVAGYGDARAQLARARRVSADAARPAARASAGPKLAPARAELSDREIEALYRHGVDAARAQQPDAAMRYWEMVWAARPGYRNVGENLKREYLARGLEAFAGGRLEDAVAQWEKVLRVDPNDARARGYLARAQQQMARSREILGGTR